DGHVTGVQTCALPIYVGTQGELNFGDFLGREEMFGAVKMRTEAHAFVGNFAKFGKAEDLVAAGIRQNRAGPRHEPMQAAESANQIGRASCRERRQNSA